MPPPPDDSTRRSLTHVLPGGPPLSRHYGLFASSARADLARARELLNAPAPQQASNADAADGTDGTEPPTLAHPCPCCGGRMIIIETFKRGCSPRTRPISAIR